MSILKLKKISKYESGSFKIYEHKMLLFRTLEPILSFKISKLDSYLY